MKREVRFASPLAVGFAVELNGQRFEVVSIEPHERVSGEPTQLIVWLADCLDCGEAFTFRLGRTMFPGERLRCEEHRSTPFTERKRGKAKRRSPAKS